MEEVFKFLSIIAIIVVGIVMQVRKEAKKNAGSAPGMPMDNAPSGLPDYGPDETYGGFIPQGPKPATAPAAKKNKKSSSRIQSTLPPQPKETPPAEVTQDADNPSEFSIRSAEEARHAIIWSEILQRKY